jgi:hypothetical protein
MSLFPSLHHIDPAGVSDLTKPASGGNVARLTPTWARKFDRFEKRCQLKNSVSVTECRAILGSEANGSTDEEIETIRDGLERTADVLFAQMVEEGRSGLDAARWDTHFRLTGKGE